MGWEAIIESIGAQIESHERLAMLDEVEELADAEHASVGLAERIRGSLGRQGTIMVDGERLPGQFLDSGTDWLLFRHRETVDIIPFQALEDVTGLTVAIAPSTRYRPTLNSVLRRLINSHVQINRLARMVEGELRAVGKDYVLVVTSQSGVGVDFSTARMGAGYSFGAAPDDSAQEHFIPLAQIKMISQARPY